MELSQWLSQQKDVRVQTVGRAPKRARPFFQAAQRIGLTIIVGATFCTIIPPKAHAFSEFTGVFTQDQEVAPHIKQEISAAQSTVKTKLPTFRTIKEVESFFLNEGKNPFAALATRMESLETTLYPDPARGRNIGIGYNIDQIGIGQAVRDLTRIGMKKEHVQIIVKEDAAQYSKVKITPNQAVDLLLLVQSRYEDIAKTWLGEHHWSKLETNQQASLSYLAYQAGGNIDQFKRAKSHIQNGNDEQAKKQLVTYYKDRAGKWQKNDRFAKHVGSMWEGEAVYAQRNGIQTYGVTKTSAGDQVKRSLQQEPEGFFERMQQQVQSGLRLFGEDPTPRRANTQP
jgi:GH24 family phage-related lysozyme (muramidase)